MNFSKNDTAVVFIDPQNDVLSETGVSWPLLHESLKENNTIENMERIFKGCEGAWIRGLHLSSLLLPYG